jgi:hypothetical protein
MVWETMEQPTDIRDQNNVTKRKPQKFLIVYKLNIQKMEKT